MHIGALITSESETEQETENSTIISPTISTNKENNQILPSNSNVEKKHIYL